MLVFGVPYISPYNVHAFLNPLLVQVLAQGYLFNMYRGAPLVKKGGTLIIFHPCTDKFDHEQHAPYIDFVHRLLPETRDAIVLRERYEEKFARDPALIQMYRTGHAYHPSHPFFMWYWGENGRQHLGRVIVVGADNEYIPKLFGWETAPNWKTRSTAPRTAQARSLDVTLLHVPPIVMGDVSLREERVTANGGANGSSERRSNGSAKRERFGASRGERSSPLDLEATFEGRRLVVVGGTGFLGKVWWSFLLARFPNVGHLYLVVREKGGSSAEERFWKEIVPTAVFDPLRDAHGAGFEAFLRDKVTPVAGDVVQPFCGLDAGRARGPARQRRRGRQRRRRRRFRSAARRGARGERVRRAEPGGARARPRRRARCSTRAPATSRAAAPATSTKTNPLEFPFPRADELERSHWDPDREIAECLDVIEQARHRASDAFRQSHFLDEAKKNLAERGEPARGAVLDAEVQKVKRKFVEARARRHGHGARAVLGLSEHVHVHEGDRRADHRALGSARSPSCARRSSSPRCEYPFPGWNEGINTSAPLIYILREGGLQIPGSDNYLDVIPCDMVAGGLTVALGELLDGTAQGRLPARFERHEPLHDAALLRAHRPLQAKVLPAHRARRAAAFATSRATSKAPCCRAGSSNASARRRSPRARAVSPALLEKAALGPARSLLEPAAKAVRSFARQQDKVGRVLSVFVPFTAQYHYIFRTDNVRSACARLGEGDRRRIGWAPDGIDWRRWFMDVHMPALENWVFPEIDRAREAPEARAGAARDAARAARRDGGAPRPRRRAPAHRIRRPEPAFVPRMARAVARLRRPTQRRWASDPGRRVLLAGSNHPSWPVAFFGILMAGGTVVPLDSTIEPDVARTLADASGAGVFLADAEVRNRVAGALDARVNVFDLHESVAPGPPAETVSRQLELAWPRSSTRAAPRANRRASRSRTRTSRRSSLRSRRSFRSARTTACSACCRSTTRSSSLAGMLLPLSRGARVVYLDQLNAERLEHALKAGRITGLVGVPALWEMLERRILARVAERGALVSHVFDFAVELNRSLGKSTGIDVGRAAVRARARGARRPSEVSRERRRGAARAHAPDCSPGSACTSPRATGSPRPRRCSPSPKPDPEHAPGHVGKADPRRRSPHRRAERRGHRRSRRARPERHARLRRRRREHARAPSTNDGWLRTGDLGKLDQQGPPRHRRPQEGRDRRRERRKRLPGRRRGAPRSRRERRGARGHRHSPTGAARARRVRCRSVARSGAVASRAARPRERVARPGARKTPDRPAPGRRDALGRAAAAHDDAQGEARRAPAVSWKRHARPSEAARARLRRDTSARPGGGRHDRPARAARDPARHVAARRSRLRLADVARALVALEAQAERTLDAER